MPRVWKELGKYLPRTYVTNGSINEWMNLIFSPLVFPSPASHAHCRHSYFLKIPSLPIYFLLKNISVSPLLYRPAFKHPILLSCSNVLSNVTSYSCQPKSWDQAGRGPLRHWIFVYSLFPDPCSWLYSLFVCLSKCDPSFNAHLSGLCNNRAHTDTAPSQNFPHPHCLWLASHQMLPCIISGSQFIRPW